MDGTGSQGANRLRELAGKTALVTGAGRGIGKRIALGLAAHGANVALLARSHAELHATQLEIEHAGSAAIALPADVRHYAEVTEAVRCTAARFEPVSIVVVAAATQGPIGALSHAETDGWRDTFDTNVLGTMHAIRAVLPGMMERRSGKILVITGGGAGAPRPNFSAYAASKAAVVRLVECVAAEVDGFNVQVNSFLPGGTYTSMTDEILKAGELAGPREMHDAEQLRLTGGISAERQIAFALFLASGRSNHINGKMIHINDDLKRLEHDSLRPDTYTLRRLKN